MANLADLLASLDDDDRKAIKMLSARKTNSLKRSPEPNAIYASPPTPNSDKRIPELSGLTNSRSWTSGTQPGKPIWSPFSKRKKRSWLDWVFRYPSTLRQRARREWMLRALSLPPIPQPLLEFLWEVVNRPAPATSPKSSLNPCEPTPTPTEPR